jgi:hypothetical protein
MTARARHRDLGETEEDSQPQERAAKVAAGAGRKGDAFGLRERHQARGAPQTPDLPVGGTLEHGLSRIDVHGKHPHRIPLGSQIVGAHSRSPKHRSTLHRPRALVEPDFADSIRE